jgi:hypothetical protein
LLSGVSGSQDFGVGTTTADKSYQGILNYITVDFDGDFFQQVVFGSSRFAKQLAGMVRVSGRNEGYIPVGVANADPLYLFAGNVPLKYLVTLETGNTLAGTLWASREHIGIRAMGNSEFAFDWVGQGAPTITWVIA